MFGEGDNLRMMLESIRNWLRDGDPMPVCKLVGMTVEAVESGWCRASIETGPQHWTPFGTVHGGLLCDLSDLAMGMAFMTTLGEGEALATIELKINFFRPVREGLLHAEARVVHRGKSTGYVECDIKDGAGRLIAKAASTCMVTRDDRAAALAGLFAKRSRNADS